MIINAGLPAQIKSTIGIVTVLIVLMFLLWLKLRKIKPEDKTPLWLVPFITLISIINNFLKQNIGKRWKTYGAIITTIAIFILISNTSSIWGITPPTSYLVVTASLALIVFITIQLTGIITNGFKNYIKGFFSPLPFLVPLNIIGEIALPLSLALRLFGSMLSGSVISILLMGLLKWAALPVLPFINVIFDIAFGAIQVVVFVLISIIYISMKIPDEEKIYS